MNLIKQIVDEKKYDTDKIIHGYHEAYCFHFDKIREKVSNILEIGVHKGGSLEMWKDYFPNAQIIGIDIIDQRYTPSSPRIKVEFGDATKQDVVNNLINKYGKFDIVIDDGSHWSSHMKKSFKLLYPHTNLIYVVEDMATQKSGFRKDVYIDERPTMMEEMLKLTEHAIDYPNGAAEFKSISFHKWQCYIYKK